MLLPEPNPNIVKKKQKSSNQLTKIDSTTNKLLLDLLSLNRQSLIILKKNYENKLTNKLIINEWKDVAARIDQILFIVAAIIIICMPIFIFKKYFFQDYLIIDDPECGC